MATYTSKPGRGYILRVVIDVLKTDYATNQSQIRANAYIVTPYDHWFQARSTGNLSIGGTTIWSMTDKTFTALKASTAFHLGGGTRWVSNAASSVQIVANFRTVNQIATWHVPPRNVTVNFPLATLVRGPKVRHNSQWRDSVLYVRYRNDWRVGRVYVKHNGEWKQAGG